MIDGLSYRPLALGVESCQDEARWPVLQHRLAVFLALVWLVLASLDCRGSADAEADAGKKPATASAAKRLRPLPKTGTCEQGNGDACDDDAIKAVSKLDYAKALTLRQRGCKAASARACARLAYAHEYGKGTRIDAKKAIGFSKKACDLGDAVSCSVLAGRQHFGWYTPKNPALAEKTIKRAAAILKEGCDAGVTKDCVALAKMLVRTFPPKVSLPGVSVLALEDRAKADYERRCPFSGEGRIKVKSDGGVAVDLGSCVKLAKLLKSRLVGRDVPRAIKLYKMACAGGDFGACWALAGIYQSGDGVPRDPVQAKAYDKLAASKTKGGGGPSAAEKCKAGDTNECNNLLHNGGRKAAPAGIRACEAGHAHACHKLGEIFSRGYSVPKSPKKAKTYYQKAAELLEASCDAGYSNDCVMLAGMHKRGNGMPKDEAAYKRWLKRACALGEACAEANR